MFRRIQMSNVPEVYYDLNGDSKLGWHPTDAITTMSQEGFAAIHESYQNHDPIQEPLISNMINDPFPIPSSMRDTSPDVQNPYGHGYIPSLTETRIQDANDVLSQENMLFSIGAVAGVSLIVLGILITSNNNSA